MIGSRFGPYFVIAFWLAAMGWLVSSKVLPALRQGEPPDYQQEFAAGPTEKVQPVAWNLFWNDQPIGFTISRAYSQEDSPSEIRSLVHFENLELGQVMREFLGGMSLLSDSISDLNRLKVDLSIASRLRLDWNGELQDFETAIKASEQMELLFLRGQRTEDDRLRLSVYTGSASESETAPFSQEFNLPSKSRLTDAFSPRSQMQNLRVGQQWTTPVVSPLATTNSVQLVESLVEKRETIQWSGGDVETFVVVYRNDAGSANLSRKPLGTAWVRDDGMVLRQEVPLGSARLRMERGDEQMATKHKGLLDGAKFDRYLHRDLSPATRDISPKRQVESDRD